MTAMIPRIEIEASEGGDFAYQVTYESEVIFDDRGFSAVEHCLVAAIEGLSPDVAAVEVAYGGIISGTYPLTVVAMNHEQVAAHALNTTAAVQEALRGG